MAGLENPAANTPESVKKVEQPGEGKREMAQRRLRELYKEEQPSEEDKKDETKDDTPGYRKDISF